MQVAPLPTFCVPVGACSCLLSQAPDGAPPLHLLKVPLQLQRVIQPQRVLIQVQDLHTHAAPFVVPGVASHSLCISLCC